MIRRMGGNLHSTFGSVGGFLGRSSSSIFLVENSLGDRCQISPPQSFLPVTGSPPLQELEEAAKSPTTSLFSTRLFLATRQKRPSSSLGSDVEEGGEAYASHSRWHEKKHLAARFYYYYYTPSAKRVKQDTHWLLLVY